MRPGQPVGAGVEAGGQNHRLANAVAGGVEEEIVEEAGAHRDRVGLRAQVPSPPSGVSAEDDVAVDQAAEEIKPHRAHQRRREWVVDDRIGPGAGQRAGRGDHRGRGADAGGQVQLS